MLDIKKGTYTIVSEDEEHNGLPAKYYWNGETFVFGYTLTDTGIATTNKAGLVKSKENTPGYVEVDSEGLMEAIGLIQAINDIARIDGDITSIDGIIGALSQKIDGLDAKYDSRYIKNITFDNGVFTF